LGAISAFFDIRACPFFNELTCFHNPEYSDSLGSTNSYADQTPRLADSSAKPHHGASFRFCGFFFPIPPWRIRFKGMNETSRDLWDFIDSSEERGLIGSRRFLKATDFSHELERRGLNLVAGDRRIEVEKCSDIPAHSSDLSQIWLNPLYCPFDDGDLAFVSLVATKIRSYVAPAEFAALEVVQRWRA
jgi:hypothetical protein